MMEMDHQHNHHHHLSEQEPCSPSSLKQKLRSSLCIIPCFTKTGSHHHAISAPSTPNSAANVSLMSASSFSPRMSRSSHHSHSHHHHHHNNHYEFAEFRDKCKNLIGRMGRGHSGRRAHSSVSDDFKYDALSYALNFDHEETNVEEYPFKSFSARLPHSPPRTPPDSAAASNEITAW